MAEAERITANLSRAAAGALLFSLPMLMTMEMWWLGFYMDRLRLMLLIVLSVPLLVGLSHYSGFEETFCWQDDLRDALMAMGVGTVMSCLVLLLFNVVAFGMTANEIIGKVAVQTVPASIGALLARSQLGAKRDGQGREVERDTGFFGELFVMGVGALFLSLNVAPTEEMILIAYTLAAEQELMLALFTLAVMHIFVYAANFRGQHAIPEGMSHWKVFLRYTVTGYALVLVVSFLVLWFFGRVDGASINEALSPAVVLSFPGAIGAAAARLVL